MVGLFCSAQEMCKWTQMLFFFSPFHFSPPSLLPLSTTINWLRSSVLWPQIPEFLPISRMLGCKKCREGGVGLPWVPRPLEFRASIPPLDNQSTVRSHAFTKTFISKPFPLTTEFSSETGLRRAWKWSYNPSCEDLFTFSAKSKHFPSPAFGNKQYWCILIILRRARNSLASLFWCKSPNAEMKSSGTLWSFCRIYKGLPRWFNELRGVQIGAGAIRSRGRERQLDRESLRQSKRQVLSSLPLSHWQATPGASEFIRGLGVTYWDARVSTFFSALWIKLLEPTSFLTI